MTAKLSTHVLDTYGGRPAKGVDFQLLFQNESGDWSERVRGRTNADGRSGGPLLEGAALETGTYRLVFQVGAYFGDQGVILPDPSFLDEVILQVRLRAGESYHVPLLVSPWSYSTYRGS